MSQDVPFFAASASADSPARSSPPGGRAAQRVSERTPDASAPGRRPHLSRSRPPAIFRYICSRPAPGPRRPSGHVYFFRKSQVPPSVLLPPLPQVPLRLPLAWRVSVDLPKPELSFQPQSMTAPRGVQSRVPPG